MPTPASLIRTLFPNAPARPVRKERERTASALSQVVALSCALLPLGVMLQAYVMTA